MNRQQRRLFNRQHKTSYTREEFERAILITKLQSGNFEFDEDEYINGLNKYIHLDSEDIAPEGCEVKLNYAEITTRRSWNKDYSDEYKKWIESNKGKVLHLTREGATSNMVSVIEDDRYEDIDGVQTKKPKWLFDLPTDLLIKYKNRYRTYFEISNMQHEDNNDNT